MRQLFEAKDGTILSCSCLHPDGKIKVCIEREKNLFDVDTDRATCWLPEYRWEDIHGFSSVEIAKAEKFIKSVIDQINESATAQSEENPNYFSALNDPYTYGGIGNDLMNDFYAHRQGGGHEMHFSRLAVYEDLHHGIKTTKEIQTVHIYEFLKFLLEQGFKSGTIRSYISSYREIYRWDPQLFCNTFEKPSVAGLNQYLEQHKSDIGI